MESQTDSQSWEFHLSLMNDSMLRCPDGHVWWWNYIRFWHFWRGLSPFIFFICLYSLGPPPRVLFHPLHRKHLSWSVCLIHPASIIVCFCAWLLLYSTPSYYSTLINPSIHHSINHTPIQSLLTIFHSTPVNRKPSVSRMNTQNPPLIANTFYYLSTESLITHRLTFHFKC